MVKNNAASCRKQGFFPALPRGDAKWNSVIESAAQIFLRGAMRFIGEDALPGGVAAGASLPAKFFHARPLGRAAVPLDGFDLIEQELARDGTIEALPA